MAQKPSVAVLPFKNLSRDEEQEFFAQGVAEDLIMALSRFPWLTVIARNSSFAYRGGDTPVNEIVDDLGGRYPVDGSVRRSWRN